MKTRVLVVDDEPAVRFTIRSLLEDAGHRVVEQPDGQSALEMFLTGGTGVSGETPSVVVADLAMPRLDGLGLLRALMQLPRPPKVVMLTAHGDERTAVAAMKAGAWDYLRKPFEIDELLAVVQRAAEAGHLSAENERLSGALTLSRSLTFVSPAMERLGVMVHRVAAREVNVLLIGESGSGKERVAEALVAASPRAQRPFVRFNCASLGAELAEAELFGHTKGAFTGATRTRPGLFREADGGTILLDEVGELAPVVQARLLRTLQSGEVRPVGEDRASRVDVRVIAATHRDLPKMVAEGSFREDLLYRLKVVQLRVPALRERPEDIPVLARLFADRAARRMGVPPVQLRAEHLETLRRQHWPGNVRELENQMEMWVATSENGEIDLGEEEVRRSGTASTPSPGTSAPPNGQSLRARMDHLERQILLEVIEQSEGNRSEAARRLEISRVTLYEKLKKHGIGGEEV